MNFLLLSLLPQDYSNTKSRLQLKLTFQPDGLWAVKVQQGSEGAAVCVILQQVLHQGERRNAPLSMLLPVPGLKPRQRHKDITFMIHHRVDMDHLLMMGFPLHAHPNTSPGVNLRNLKQTAGTTHADS